MPYCKEFNDLFSTDSATFQNSPFEKIELTKKDVEKILKSSDCQSTLLRLNELFDKYIKSGNSISPFHLGLGNPDSNILIVGQELAINPDAPDPVVLNNKNCNISNYYRNLFVNEAILNFFLWECKVNGMPITPNCCIQDPEFASSYCHLYNEEKNWNGHYWAKISIAIGAYLNRNYNSPNEALFFRTKIYPDSFFNHVFLTELHDIPSAQAPRIQNAQLILQKINDLATIPFFRKFKRIVFACRTYLNGHLPNYSATIITTYNVNPIQSDLSRNIRNVFESNNQKIIVCNNLGGAAGWTNTELQTLGNLLK